MAKRDYGDWNKADLIKRIEALEKRKKYGLVWDEESTREEFEAESRGKLPVLVEDKSKEIRAGDDQPTHIIIEGDNYHALSVLNYTHGGEIDVIYIDPPYNTGSSDFVFNDNYVDKDDPYKHSKWLSFIKNRLYLAKALLKEDGVIFISIDDNEQARLKILCDEIFLEKNFISTIIWQRVYGPKNQSRRISTDHEYILAYAKNIELLDFNLLPRTEKMDKRYKNPDNDPRGLWQSGDLIASEERKNGHYILKSPSGDQFDAPPGKHWAFSKEKMTKFIDNNRIWFGANGHAFPRLKQFLSEVQSGRKASTLFLHTEVGHNDEAKKELRQYFEQSDHLFSTPKPTRLIKQLLQLHMNKNAIVLDFMAGSGTTAEATIKLNQEDFGGRKFILCTNNENRIMEEVCYPRVKKVILGYTNTKDEDVGGLGGNLKSFKTSFVSGESTDANKVLITQRSVEMLCLREDCFEVVEQVAQWQVYRGKQKHTAILFEPEAIAKFRERLLAIEGPVSVYVFSLSDETYAEAFAGIEERVTLCAVPESILKVYRRIFQ